MYIVDITRKEKNNYESDMLFGKLTTDAKTKTLDYIIDYALANCNIRIDKRLLDSELDITRFSLKNFIKDAYHLDIEQDLLIQVFPFFEEDKCVVKTFNNDGDGFPSIHVFEDEKLSKSYMAYLINDSLINTLAENNKLDDYEKEKVDVNNFDNISYSYNNNSFEMTSLYNGGLFLEELLNNSLSLKQQKDKLDVKI